MKKKLTLGIIGVAMAALLAGCGVEQTATEITVEKGAELHIHASEFLSVDESKDHNVTIDASKVDVNKVGEYELTATYKGDTFTLKVIVADTQAPAVEFLDRYETTADIAAMDMGLLYDVAYDASEYEVTYAAFEKVGELAEVNDEYLKNLEAGIEKDQTKLAEMVASEVTIPTEEGVYKTILSFKDEHNNEQLEVVYIVLDLTEEATETEEDTDTETDEDSDNVTSNSSSSNKGSSSSKNNTAFSNSNSSGNSSSSSSNSNSSSNSANSGNSGSSSSGSESNSSSDSEEVETPGLTPTQTMAVSKGYYNVFVAPTGSYCVMVRGDEYSYGIQLIREYLATMGLEIIGGQGEWINSDKDQFMAYVDSSQVREITSSDDPNDPNFWG